MLKKWALAVMVSLIPVLTMAQENPPSPAGDQAERRPSQRQGVYRFPAGVSGTVTVIDKDQLSLKSTDGRTVTVKVTADTRYQKDRKPATLADFKIGDEVMVGGDPGGENALNARFVATQSGRGCLDCSGREEVMREGLGKRFIAGEIKSIDGTSLTILRMDGETQTIQVDENTSFRKQGESITLADFKPGDHVFGRGEVKNGTFVAAVLNAGDSRQMGPPRPQGSPDRH